MRTAFSCIALLGLAALVGPASMHAQTSPGVPPTVEPGQTLVLTLDGMVELGLRDSYRVRQLQLGVERTRSLLNAERASLRSRVQLVVNAPEIEAITENKWNSCTDIPRSTATRRIRGTTIGISLPTTSRSSSRTG